MSGQNERIAEIQRRIIEFVSRNTPPGSRRIDLHCIATVAVNDMALTVLTEDGKVVRPESMPQELTDMLLELRRAHYLAEQGTWFSARFMLEPGAPIRPIFNYDFDPNWDPPIPVECWQRDQIVMPRDGAHLPPWLRDRLDGREPAYEGVFQTDPLNPMEQMEILSNEFCILVADQAPPLWDLVFGYYQVVGDHVECPAAMVQLADRTMTTWSVPAGAQALLQRLRAGTYAFQHGAWSRIDYRVLYEEGAVRVQAQFTNQEEPAWNAEPSVQDVRLEVERFPEHGSRDWIKRRLDAAGGGGTPPRQDRAPEDRAPLPEAAPAGGGIRKARVFDHVGPDGEGPSVSRPAVPQGEVARLVEYLRRAPVVMAARSYAPDQIDSSRGERVPLTFHTDGAWVWAGAVGYYLEEHGIPPEPELVAHARARGFQIPELDDDTMDAASAAVTGRSAPPRINTDPRGSQPPSRPAPPPAPEPAPAASPVVSALEGRLDELGVPSGAYRIGGVADGAWSLLPEGGSWAVFLSENGERRRRVVFETEEQAAAYLLGSLLFESPAAASADGTATVDARPIEPLTGEPPLTLFRERREVEVPAGTPVDRYGGDRGNVTYALGTPFAERSLPPDWANRPYQAYRLQRPLRALTGVAVPWFDQPGGGTAYVFERSLADLVADGSLIPVQDA
ncbi:TNT domain-containing protein [Spirillospora sp. CA-255316]